MLPVLNNGILDFRHVKVRFKFGVNKEIAILPVLVMDLRSKPFRDIRFPYVLYGTLTSGVEPTEDSRDTDLYCRGLKVGAYDAYNVECLYTYARVMDQGLIKQSGSIKVPLTSSFPQVKSVSGSNYTWLSSIRSSVRCVRNARSDDFSK
jgi:hypothetical protein